MNTTTKIVPYNDRIRELKTSMTGRLKVALKEALPTGMDPDRFIRIVLSCVQQNPGLLDCDRTSLFTSAIQCAALGLEPDPVLGQAYMVPFKGKVKLMPGYKGLVDLCRRSDKVLAINAAAVHEGDLFEFDLGSAPFVRHRKTLNVPGEFIAAYAVAELRDARQPQVVVLSKHDVVRAMEFSQSARKEDSPWRQHFDAMAVKTAVKQLTKLLPVTVQLQRAVALDDAAEAGIDQVFDVDLPASDVAAEPVKE